MTAYPHDVLIVNALAVQRAPLAQMQAPSPPVNMMMRLLPVALILGCLRYSYSNPLLIPLLLAQDLACLFLDISGGALKLGWRLMIALFVGINLLRLIAFVVMSGGPIKALQRAVFASMACCLRGMETLCSRAAPVSSFCAKLATACEARTPTAAMPNLFGGALGNAFGGAASNPFGGAAGNPFGGAAGNPFGGAAGNPFGGAGSPFDAAPFAGADSLFGGEGPASAFGAFTAPDGSVQSKPFVASSRTPGVSINVRRRGNTSSPSESASPPSDANDGAVIDVSGVNDENGDE